MSQLAQWKFEAKSPFMEIEENVFVESRLNTLTKMAKAEHNRQLEKRNPKPNYNTDRRGYWKWKSELKNFKHKLTVWITPINRI